MLVSFRPSVPNVNTPSVNRKNPDKTSFQSANSQKLVGNLSDVIGLHSSNNFEVRQLLYAIAKNNVIIDPQGLLVATTRINELRLAGKHDAAEMLQINLKKLSQR